MNVAAAFDRGFLNLFPQSPGFVYDAGGYLRLNFIPSLATMLLGLIAGGILWSERREIAKFWWLPAAARQARLSLRRRQRRRVKRGGNVGLECLRCAHVSSRDPATKNATFSLLRERATVGKRLLRVGSRQI